MEVTCHPRLWVASSKANSPVDFCSEQPAAAGLGRGSLESNPLFIFEFSYLITLILEFLLRV